MKGVFSAEAIGLPTSMDITARMCGIERDMHRQTRPWVAEVTGRSRRYGYERRFVKPKVDYSGANSAGTRGVRYWWTLESGHLYQARYRTDWSMAATVRYLTVTDEGDVVDVPREEVDRWVSGDSASTS